jgi:hypothetical protein
MMGMRDIPFVDVDMPQSEVRDEYEQLPFNDEA